MTLAKLYEEAARVAKLIEGTDIKIEECIKHDGHVMGSTPFFDSPASFYEFALAIVEGKPVFKGDVIYGRSGVRFIAGEIRDSYICERGYSLRGSGVSQPPSECMWNPPKPKTVFVELLREDAKNLSNGCPNGYYNGVPLVVVANACYKALDE
jgi:hypothetical protein